MAETLTAPLLSTSALDAPTKPVHVPPHRSALRAARARLFDLRLRWMPPLCDPLSGLRSQADEDDAELSETQTADGQTSNSEGEQDSEHGEPAAEAQSDTKKKKKGRASKSAIGKTAKQPPAKESPTRTRVAGKRTIVAPDIYNPEKLSEKHAEPRQLATKGKKVQAKKRASKS
jgi:hypothetical protein